MADCIIELKQINKSYKSKAALRQIDLKIHRGEIFGLIGRNGAGKSTLLKLIGGLIYPSSGSLQIFSRSVKEHKELYERMGLLVENPGLYPQYTGYENLNLLATAYGLKDRGRINEMLRLVGLEKSGSRKVKDYSLGMKQRLGIAMALLGSPDVLILDEPINGLDPQGIVDIRKLLIELNQTGLTIIISSHILEELSKIATKYGILHDGELVEVMSREELLRRCEERVEIEVSEAQAAIPVLESELGISRYKVLDGRLLYVYDRHVEPHEINSVLVNNGVTVHAIYKHQQSLEQYFLERTEKAGVKHA